MKKVRLFSNWHGGVMVKAVVYEARWGGGGGGGGGGFDSQLGQEHF